MKCIIPGLNVKILGRTVHAFARIGDDLYIECLPNGLSLRTLNAAESAYAMVTFNKSFFSYFNHDYFITEDAQGLKCKISMKSALIVFKSPGNIDKVVDQLEIRLEPEMAKLVFQMKCKHGIVKTHYVPILDCKTMQAIYTKEMVPNRLTVQHKVLSETASNFLSSEDQMTFDVCTNAVLLRNYIDNDLDLTKIIRTQIALKASEFETFTVGAETTITFSMKEYRAVLAFAEAVNFPVSLHFETTGNPVIFIITNGALFEANFVLATMHEDLQSPSVATVQTADKTIKRKTSVPPATNGKRVHMEDPEISKRLDEDEDLFNFIDIPEGEAKMNTTKQNSAVSKLVQDSVMEGTIYDNTINHTVVTTNLLKTVFKRCFDSTQGREQTEKRVLAYDSDCE